MFDDRFKLNQPFLRVGDRVEFAEPDGDMHILTREGTEGEVTDIQDRDNVTVKWDDGEIETLSEDSLGLL